jgi:hypothetical protein
MKRDNFSNPVRDLLAKRAGYLCSNPNCRKVTSLPNSDPNKATSIGIAAHIHAASKRGPRYNALQSPQERKAPENGIWLCSDCSIKIDRDTKKYDIALIRSWKEEHTRFLLEGGFLPKPPTIFAKTLDGLYLPSNGPFKIDGNDSEIYRDHEFVIGNEGRSKLENISLRVQFPESIVTPVAQSIPSGVHLQCRPDTMQMVGFTSGGGSISRTGGSRPHPIFRIEISHLLPGTAAALILRCIVDDIHDCEIRPMEWCTAHFAQGTYSYCRDSEFSSFDIIALIGYEKILRKISILHVSDDPESFTRSMIQIAI